MSPEAAASGRQPKASGDNRRFVVIWVVIGLVAVVAAVIVVLNIVLAPPPQTKADACAILNPAVGAVSAEISSSLENIQANPTASLDRLETASTTFATEVGKVDVAALKKQGGTAKTDLAKLVNDIKEYLAGSSEISDDQLGATADTVTADLTAIQEACK